MKLISNFSFRFTSIFLLSLPLFIGFLASSCESKEESILKVYVRDESNDLLPKAKVIIIGNTKSNPATIDYVDTVFTDELGVAVFNMEEFYTLSGKSVNSGFFDVLVKHLEKNATGEIRVKEHITSVLTVNFQP
ncbi:MAG: hypothetical protein V4622_14300 [Bacteroidota bacterium]